MDKELQQLLDKSEINEVVQKERAFRDQARWDEMQAAFHDDSVVDLSWFKGSGPEFVASSRRLYEAGRHSAHQMGPTLVSLIGSRALASTSCAVCLRTRLSGVEVELTAHSRLYERLEKRDGEWRIARMGIVYLRDLLIPVNPAERVEIDNARLSAFRSSYRFLSYLLAETGVAPRDDLPGEDRPETVKPMLDADLRWLEAGE
ncbi:nuclear transport factor 2 family protein [Paraburkholderia sp.]|uniref:nuclear transport factor 2 family protein n=1 Tax=Paraburkholderia sp. TaxID=1926495 RepID=UPI002D2782D8|nr:nuclear transport factor 2 family protein [Paraburkholderia sp.]HZZ02655.1 nuclear transport factor 2 family protein [Paraburkholderia sp.]